MSEAIASKEERLVRYNANIAAADKDPQLSPETGKPLSKVNTIRFGAGFLLFGVLWMSGLGIVSAVLLPMHYKTIEGADPDALVGIVNAFTAVASLVANLMFGNFSDRSRSRFGRRTPWIVFGAVLGGVTLFLTGTTHNAVLLTIFYCACMFGLNCMIAPMVAILSDRVPSKIRGTMSAFYGAGSTIGAPIGTMLGALFIENRLLLSILKDSEFQLPYLLSPSEYSDDLYPLLNPNVYKDALYEKGAEQSMQMLFDVSENISVAEFARNNHLDWFTGKTPEQLDAMERTALCSPDNTLVFYNTLIGY